MDDNELPEGWTTATIGDTAEYINGRGFKKSEWEGDGRPIIRIQNLTGTADEFNYTTLDVDEKYVVPPDTILVSWSATLDAFRWHGPEGVLNQHIFKVVPNEELVNEDFLFWLLKREIQEMVRSAKLQGSTMKHIRRDSFLDHEFPLPPELEQRRIADRLDAIQSRTQKTGETLDQVPDRIDEYRQSVLNAAFTGQLTADWRVDHPELKSASKLLQTLKGERRDFWEANYRWERYDSKGKEPPSGWKDRFKEFEQPDDSNLKDLPDSWTWVQVRQAGQVQLGRQRAPEYHEGDNMCPYLRVANVFEDQIDTSDVKEMHFSERDFKKYKLEEGDILINEGQSLELVGRPAMFRGEVENACFQNTLIRFRGYNSLDRSFALIIFRAFLHNGRFADVARQTTSVAHLGSTRFSKMPFPLPPLPEQKEIARRANQRLEKIDEMAAHVDGARKRLDHLDRSVLAKAFRGDLVETEAERARREDRDYETAEELLQRVQGEPSTPAETDSSASDGPDPDEEPVQVNENGQFEMKVVKDEEVKM